MAGAIRRADTSTVRELSARVAWRRQSVQHQYVGRLLALPDRLRLVGHDPSFGFDVALSVPFAEIERISPALHAWGGVLGELGLRIEIVGASPIFLRELGSRGGPARLARRLEAAISPSAP